MKVILMMYLNEYIGLLYQINQTLQEKFQAGLLSHRSKDQCSKVQYSWRIKPSKKGFDQYSKGFVNIQDDNGC